MSDLLDNLTGALVVFRAANVALSLAAFAFLYIRLNDTWARLSPGVRMARVGIVILALAGAIGSAVKYVLHAPADPSILLVTAATLLIDIGMWRSRHEPNNHT